MSTNVAIRTVFETYTCGKPEMNSHTFVRVFKDLNILTKKFTAADLDIIFSKVRGPKRSIDFNTFFSALGDVAAKRGVDTTELVDKLAKSTMSCYDGTKTKATPKADGHCHAPPTASHDHIPIYHDHSPRHHHVVVDHHPVAHHPVAHHSPVHHVDHHVPHHVDAHHDDIHLHDVHHHDVHHDVVIPACPPAACPPAACPPSDCVTVPECKSLKGTLEQQRL